MTTTRKSARLPLQATLKVLAALTIDLAPAG
jgi:hypothetical protein